MKLARLSCVFAILCFAAFLSLPALAQIKVTKFGDISASDLAMTTYAGDTSASAVVLSDVGTSYYRFRGEDDFKYIFNRHVRIKILKKSGYEYADASIRYYRPTGSSKEIITNLKAATYNLVSSRVVTDKLTKESIFDEKTTDFGVSRRKFTFPNVKEGSVIEYSYTIESDFFSNSRTWDFQGAIPTIWSEYTNRIPEFFDFKMISRGYESFVINNKKIVNENLGGAGWDNARVNEYHWAMQDVPALNEEPYMTALKDFRAGIDFELALISIPGKVHQPFMDTWPRINNNLLLHDQFGKQLNRTSFAKKEITDLMAQHSDPTRLMEAIYGFVANHIKWNKVEDVLTDQANSTKKAFETRMGGSADINLLLVALLREAKLQANPVILSTRENGRVDTNFPMVKKFNYVVAMVKIGDQQYLLDATEPLVPVNMLPERCLNGQGFVISEHESGWVNLSPKHKHQSYVNAQMTIDQTGTLSGQVIDSRGGYAALPVRRTISVDGQQKYVENWKKEVNGFDIGEVKIQDLETLGEALKITYAISMEGQPGAKVLYVNPMLSEGVKENPFKLEDRKFPVDMMAAHDQIFICKLTIPEGYTLEEKPKDTIVTLPNGKGRFTFSITSLGQHLQITSNISLPQPVYFAEEYPFLKEFYNLIVAKHAEQIVLKKL